jgi:hypothetical protein
MKDPIIEEVRRVRKQIEADCGNDWEKLARHVIERQNASPAKVARYSPKKLRCRQSGWRKGP